MSVLVAMIPSLLAVGDVRMDACRCRTHPEHGKDHYVGRPSIDEVHWYNVPEDSLPPCDDLRVREAFIHGIDRQVIVDTLHPQGPAQVGVSRLPPDYFGHIPVEMPEYNLALSHQLLTA